METKDLLLNVPQVKLTYVDTEYKARPQIFNSADMEALIRPFFDCIQHHEEIYGILLSNQNKVLGVIKLGEGNLTECTINTHALYQSLILSNAKGVILVHNHPSGTKFTSPQDDKLTEMVKEGCKLLNCTLLDHIILTYDEYYSYTDEGRL